MDLEEGERFRFAGLVEQSGRQRQGGCWWRAGGEGGPHGGARSKRSEGGRGGEGSEQYQLHKQLVTIACVAVAALAADERDFSPPVCHYKIS